MRIWKCLVSNVKYRFSSDGKVGTGTLPDGTCFLFDYSRFSRIKDRNWYRRGKNLPDKKAYIIDRDGIELHRTLFDVPKGYEVDHINLNTMDNRSCNLRICTHQANQCNQPPQCNNTSGVSGVSLYLPSGKFRARIKICQHDIHLGYYETFEQAVQARNVGMDFMFGEYGLYNDVPETPDWIKDKVTNICRRFADLSISEASFHTPTPSMAAS